MHFFKNALQGGGVIIPDADVHRRGGANRWTCADMGEEGVKNLEKTADVLCEWPLRGMSNVFLQYYTFISFLGENLRKADEIGPLSRLLEAFNEVPFSFLRRPENRMQQLLILLLSKRYTCFRGSVTLSK